MPNGPNDVATFNLSNVTNVSFSSSVEVGRLSFGAGASPFIFTVSPGQAFDIAEPGVVNDSGTDQTLVAATNSILHYTTIGFHGHASAGSSMTYINHGGTAFGSGGFIEFHDYSSANDALFLNESDQERGAEIDFYDYATAGSATVVDDGPVFEDADADRAQVAFWDNASAGNATLTLEAGTPLAFGTGGTVYFFGLSTADHGTFTLNGATESGGYGNGAQAILDDHSTAAEATFIVNGGQVEGAQGALLVVEPAASLGTATLIFNGGVGSGGRATMVNSLGSPRTEIFGNGQVEIGRADRPSNLGSIEGDGNLITYYDEPVQIGSNNLTTTFSGVISGSAAIVKLGTGTLTLSGANTYTATTTLNAGALKVGNRIGSATGTGAVSVDAGTLGGRGTITGATTIGTGNGAGAFLEPSVGARQPATTTIQSLLTFKADGSYTYKLDTRKARADEVVANGVTIESGAQFNFSAIGNKRLPLGSVFVALSNTSASPISGAFANLADGSIFTAGKNKYQASYSGGDGNDLTLTVVP